ncbi:histone acetylation protein-domain-containing protein [Fimicolochytrium jonesii]|uniref:histone acetylation protein-domain-containing protein n=1 Tax=Fimicolochytrium jonesii TaxID=1396493 RepID=UPI0022FE5807|nr:histone acetylation protein-domain-containing protein [Fimicolochytrium jonesii]KAI8822249.1 histone acetylation protein-domain-containing protein [Fimicolochytrium jonesii]
MNDLCKAISGYLPKGTYTHSYHVHAATSPVVPDASLFPTDPTIQVDRTDRLISLSAVRSTTPATPQTQDAQQQDEVFIFSMSVSEYTITPTKDARPAVEHYIYIEKVDTSGAMDRDAQPKVSSSRAVVLGYLEYILHALGISATVSIHVFARPQPEYLFNRSDSNPGKTQLSDLGLLKWWMKTLSLLKVDSASSRMVSGHLYVPGESTRTLNEVFKLGDSSPTVVWSWFLPYHDDALALQVVPRFPDDARTKVLTEHADETTTVAEMKEMLPLTGECNGRRSGFFTVTIESAEAGGRSSGAEPPMLLPTTKSRAEFERLLESNAGLSFDDVAAARESSATMLQNLRRVRAASGTLAPSNESMAAPPENKRTVVPVNNIQGLIKSKTGSIQGLVKRKVTPVQSPATPAMQEKGKVNPVGKAIVDSQSKTKASFGTGSAQDCPVSKRPIAEDNEPPASKRPRGSETASKADSAGR